MVLNCLTLHALTLYIQLFAIVSVFIFSKRLLRPCERAGVIVLLFYNLALAFLSGIVWLVFCKLLLFTTRADWLMVGVSMGINLCSSALYFVAAIATSLVYSHRRTPLSALSAALILGTWLVSTQVLSPAATEETQLNYEQRQTT